MMKVETVNSGFRGFNQKAWHAQRGVALVVSLVLLVAMTILGVATLSGTRLNELIASNSQQKSIAFEAAESAIGSVLNYDDLYGAIVSNQSGGRNSSDIVKIPDAKSRLTKGYDLLNSEGIGVNIDGTLGVQFCGEAQPEGTSLSAALDGGQFSAILVDINSQVDIVNTGASADHLRRVSFLMPQTGRTGNCTVRN